MSVGEEDGSIRDLVALESQLWDRYSKLPDGDKPEFARRVIKELAQVSASFGRALDRLD
jgi:hypothetical protein